MQQAARSMLAMSLAANNTDRYITKCNTTSNEQLQNLIGQFAIGLRPPEQDEEREQSTAAAAVLQNL